MESQNDLDGKSLSPGPFTFTRDRIESILRDDCFVRDPNSSESGVPSPFLCEAFGYSFEAGIIRSYTKEEHDLMLVRFCTHLHELAQGTESHISCLDDAFSTILVCKFQPEGPISAILDRTVDLLTRVPAIPLELPDLPGILNSAYFIPSALGNEGPIAVQWNTLQVAVHVSSNIIRCALIVTMISTGNSVLTEFIDSIAELLEVASRLSSEAENDLMKQRWFIVRAFLWTSWQRCTMIFYSVSLKSYLDFGFNHESNDLLLLRGTVPSPRLSIQEMSKLYAGSKKSKYMCGWAFELLRNEPTCIGMDFRRFHLRYSEAFKNYSSRCIVNQFDASCKGNEPDLCQRFKGMFIENQSAHDYGCPRDCKRLTWNEASYRSVSGARAVLLDDSTGVEPKINYCEASNKTLAVSHVWSHGQGGRPEEPHGFNHCLHRRYISIAKSLGCTSYWMDTPCIPEDHELRAESISKINEVFFQSKVTLVCDRDLMEIDITNLTIEVQEQIIAVAIVCDWNLRSWTFLEAFRGRDAIRLLCKDNKVVSLIETAKAVSRYGSVDIGILLLTAPHLLPSQVKRDSYVLNLRTPGSINGYLSVETGGNVLSHREASRSGDDIVIWSLLLHEEVFDDAELFWRSREGQYLNTGFLLSSVPRLGIRGLGWAPSSPSAHLVTDGSSKVAPRLLSHDGRGSEMGEITSNGFLATWFMYDFDVPGMKSRVKSAFFKSGTAPSKLCRRNILRIKQKYMKGYLSGSLLRPISSKTSKAAAPNPIGTSSILVIVCATNDMMKFRSTKDDEIYWEWKGIYEWDLTEPLPKFTRYKNVLIV